jgi:hypothetical protein
MRKGRSLVIPDLGDANAGAPINVVDKTWLIDARQVAPACLSASAFQTGLPICFLLFDSLLTEPL